jgi:hypothetical protein
MGEAMRIALLLMAVLHGAPAWAQSIRFEAEPGAKVDWTELPNGQDHARAATLHGVARGEAIVACTINDRRRPDDCSVLQANDLRDGRVGVELAKAHRAEKLDDAGVPVVGRKVTFHFDFSKAPGS